MSCRQSVKVGMRLGATILLLSLSLPAVPLAQADHDANWVEFPALKDFNGVAVQLNALQFRPQGRGPFPAIVLLHGCGGMYTPAGYVALSYRTWAELLAEDGYVTLLVDSFNPRGYRTICELQKRPILENRERVQDAYAALQWLARQDYVQPDRVGLLGWSNGGTGTLYAMRQSNQPERGFRSAVAFYPGCSTIGRAKPPYRPYAPLLILNGEADDWTPALPCRQVAEAARGLGAEMNIISYPGAYHAFDRVNLPVRYRPNVRNLNKPDRLGATVGGNPQAREDAVRRTREFFARMLKGGKS